MAFRDKLCLAVMLLALCQSPAISQQRIDNPDPSGHDHILRSDQFGQIKPTGGHPSNWRSGVGSRRRLRHCGGPGIHLPVGRWRLGVGHDPRGSGDRHHVRSGP